MVAAADGSLTGQTPQGDTLRVREVWQDNLEAEMKVGGGGGSRGAAAAAAPPAPTSPMLASRHNNRPRQLIRDVVDDFPFLAMDTEFPGVVARPVGNFKNSGEYHYQTLRWAPRRAAAAAAAAVR